MAYGERRENSTDLFINGMMKEIKNEADYHKVMTKIDGLMAKGSDKVSKEELNENPHTGTKRPAL